MSILIAAALVLSVCAPIDAYMVGGAVRGGVIESASLNGAPCAHTAGLFVCQGGGDVALTVRPHSPCRPMFVSYLYNQGVWRDLPPIDAARVCVYVPGVIQ